VTSCIVDSAAIYIMVVKFRNTTVFPPLHRSSSSIGGLRYLAIQKEQGPHIAERTQKAVYIVRCLWDRLIYLNFLSGIDTADTMFKLP
jgi:hypothetical protein